MPLVSPAAPLDVEAEQLGAHGDKVGIALADLSHELELVGDREPLDVVVGRLAPWLSPVFPPITGVVGEEDVVLAVLRVAQLLLEQRDVALDGPHPDHLQSSTSTA